MKETKPKNSQYTKSVETWFNFYRKKTGQEYVMDGMQGKHLKHLLKKIEVKLKQKGLEVTDENVVNSLNGFLHHLNDNWILEHLEISIVNSKFNVLYAKATRNSPFNQRIDDIVDSKYGTGRAAGQNEGN